MAAPVRKRMVAAGLCLKADKLHKRRQSQDLGYILWRTCSEPGERNPGSEKTHSKRLGVRVRDNLHGTGCFCAGATCGHPESGKNRLGCIAETKLGDRMESPEQGEKQDRKR